MEFNDKLPVPNHRYKAADGSRCTVWGAWANGDGDDDAGVVINLDGTLSTIELPLKEFKAKYTKLEEGA